MKLGEIMDLKREDPARFQRALTIERTARDGKHGLDKIKGLGRSFAWEWIENATDEDDAREIIVARGGKVGATLRP